MENEFEKYFVETDKDWHQNIVGEYHVSLIGTTKEESEDPQHYGPCLRFAYWEYVDTLPYGIESEGEFKMGDLLHEEVQRIRKINKPASIAEFPLAMYIWSGEELIKIMGSIDLLEFSLNPAESHKIMFKTADIKTASPYTFPRSPYEFNETYIGQVYIYTYWLYNYFLNKETFKEPEVMEIIYIKKASPALETGVQTKNYDPEVAKSLFNDFCERSIYLHNTIKKEEVPPAEPHRWCKYCKYRKRCKEYDKK